MEPASQGLHIFHFGVFELDVRSGELRKQGQKTRLPPQSFQVLLLLLERPGEVVTREELRQKLWPADTFVDFDMGLSSAVKKLRDALGDAAESPRFVETLPRRGYRFIAPVGQAAAPPLRQTTAEARAKFHSGVRWRWVVSGAAVAAALAALLALNVGGCASGFSAARGSERLPRRSNLSPCCRSKTSPATRHRSTLRTA